MNKFDTCLNCTTQAGCTKRRMCHGGESIGVPIDEIDLTAARPDMRFEDIQQHHSKAFRMVGDISDTEAVYVYHCFGERVGAWNDATRHWLEVRHKYTFLRGDPTLYESPATIIYDGKTYVAFSAYYEGGLPHEEVCELRLGVIAFPDRDKS